MKKILLAYSGGLDTSCILTWLKEKYNVPIVAYCANVGQEEDFEAVKVKALKTGAEKCIVDDLKAEFVKDFIWPSIQANAVYEAVYLLGTSLARPCIAQGMVEAALREGCDYIAHGATGKGNDQVRFELAIKSLAPQLGVIAPWREWEYQSRTDLFAYAEKHGIPLPITKEKPYSMDANLMHISYEGGILEDPWQEAPENIYLWTKNPEEAPDKPQYVEIQFEQGVPVAIDGVKLEPVALLEKANEMAAAHGVGRIDLVENRFIGIKSRGVYETPGVTILMQAHQAVESLTLDKEVAHLKQSMVSKIAELTYNGFWFAPETQLLHSFIKESQASVTGTAKIKMYKGTSMVVARKSEQSLYSEKMTSFENMSSFNPADSGGFININGLRLSAWSNKNASIKKSLHPTA
ncbi:MAG: argininosuccinate synthase [Candidatus Obscuribacter sp.]|nr:argininosuccinate synthase [Candidatus Obscuribacter sp.]MBP6347923.1 argininosuccinate synthase [Candidatus Obscuribacter sp.]MBP6591376.1 argininosuccinate synthase [Candidatus Obscuribacter sp.]MBP7576229.1 argininosuccinate synthase [Candidatus Obscuribacter sp.]